jgi:hypothetical protein
LWEQWWRWWWMFQFLSEPILDEEHVVVGTSTPLPSSLFVTASSFLSNVPSAPKIQTINNNINRKLKISVTNTHNKINHKATIFNPPFNSSQT